MKTVTLDTQLRHINVPPPGSLNGVKAQWVLVVWLEFNMTFLASDTLWYIICDLQFYFL